MMRWGRFTAGTGGSGAFEALGSTSSKAKSLPNRYLFSCRCGMIDMRHFYQLMWIGLVRNNQAATDKGREHELTSEATSRFAPEDTPSNAMGAYFGSQESTFERQSTFIDHLQGFLGFCDPLDFTAMSKADQDAIVEYYGARDSAGVPMYQNETAVPDRLFLGSISACSGRKTSSPFAFDESDPHKKTISGFRLDAFMPEPKPEYNDGIRLPGNMG